MTSKTKAAVFLLMCMMSATACSAARVHADSGAMRLHGEEAARGALEGKGERLRSWELDLPGRHDVAGVGSEAAPGPLHEAGYFKLNRTVEAEMFYFYFEHRSMAADAPIVLWMTGGPGCSSELAVFYENGPFHIRDDLTLEDNPFGWDTVVRCT